MDFYSNNSQAGFKERKKWQIKVICEEEYKFACHPTAINLYFKKMVYLGPENFLDRNKYLFKKNKLKFHSKKVDKYNLILGKEVKIGQKIWKRKHLYLSNRPCQYRDKIDQKINTLMHLHKKLLISISWNKIDPFPSNKIAVEKFPETVGHFYLCSLENGRLNFADGEGNWSVMHKLEKNYLNLISFGIYIYV